MLFFCIEILPVMVKVLLNIGPLSTYETLLKNEEDILTDKAKLKRVTKRRDAEREADKQIAIDEDMRRREEDLGKKANQHVAEHMEAILDLALEEWGRQVQAQLGAHLPPGVLPGTAGAPGGTPVHVTGPQPRLSITGPQPVLGASGSQPSVNGGYPGSSYNSANGNHGNGHHGQPPAPKITYLMPPGGGTSLPDEEDGDIL